MADSKYIFIVNIPSSRKNKFCFIWIWISREQTVFDITNVYSIQGPNKNGGCFEKLNRRFLGGDVVSLYSSSVFNEKDKGSW